MSDYIGARCIICEKNFEKDDEIVVCPECGTPYHRECYFKEGKCVNNILHSKNQSWKSTFQKEETDADTIKCKACGEENPQNGLFCNKCGSPLNQTQGNTSQQGELPPFFAQAFSQEGSSQNTFTPESEIEGITIKEYNEYVGSNQIYFISQFIRFGKFGGKLSLNIFALFFPEFYYFYRKMNLVGVLFFALRFFLQIPFAIQLMSDLNYVAIADYLTKLFSVQTLNVISFLSGTLGTAMLFGSAVLANYLYYNKAKKDINRIKSDDITDDEKLSTIRKKGGVSQRNLFIAIMFPFIVSAILLAIYNFIV